MKLFKDSENNVFAYEENGSQDYLIGDKVSITQEEANTIIDLKLAPLIKEEKLIEEKKNSALAKLAALGLTQDEVKALVG